MTLGKAQQEVDQWIKNIGGGYFSELTNLGILTEETGELARWLVRKYGDQNMKPSEKEINIQEAIEDEVADIFWVLVCLANQMDIDLENAFLKNLEKKITRDKNRHV
jgi:NTP pyrophosphatase (non-canonical NTP hydrolase)